MFMFKFGFEFKFEFGFEFKFEFSPLLIIFILHSRKVMLYISSEYHRREKYKPMGSLA